MMSRREHARILALFPGALGDLLCCWPALEGLRRATGAALTLAARDAWFAALPADAVTPLSIDRPELSDLFRSGPLQDATRSLFAGFARVESWTGHGDGGFAHRLAEASGLAVAVHPFRALRPGEHASQYYGRCVGVVPVVEALPIRPAAAVWADALFRRHAPGVDTLVLHPGSGSARKSWEGMAAAAAAWRERGGPVIALCGPAEDEQPLTMPHDVAVRSERLDRVAALLARAPRFLGNDSGLTHLAARVGARGVALFGPTDPRAWRPLGDRVRVLYAPQVCPRCGADRFCTHRLAVGDVVDALGAL